MLESSTPHRSQCSLQQSIVMLLEVNTDLRQSIFPLIAPNSPIQYSEHNNIFLKESPKKKHS